MKPSLQSKLYFVAFALLFLFSCKPTDKDFIGTWIEGNGQSEMAITKEDVYFNVSGFPSHQENILRTTMAL